MNVVERNEVHIDRLSGASASSDQGPPTNQNVDLDNGQAESWSRHGYSDLRCEQRAGAYRAFGKRTLDICGSAALLALLAPLFVILAITAALDGGPPLFSHRRVGLGGRLFSCHKFRSMVVDAEARLAELLVRDPEAAAEWARDHKLSNDPRVTRAGDFLRKSSLDELPQLINVLLGEMSLVGPRPVTQAELRRYGPHSRHYLSVKPGLTGPWQVSGRNDLDYDERVLLDTRYTATISLWGDIMILFKTVFAVLRMTGR